VNSGRRLSPGHASAVPLRALGHGPWPKSACGNLLDFGALVFRMRFGKGAHGESGCAFCGSAGLAKSGFGLVARRLAGS